MSFDMLMDDLYTDEITVIRYSKTKLVGGKQKASALPPFKTMGSVQPVGGRERENLPDNFRQRYVVELFVSIPLLLDDDKKKQRADNLRIEGEEFEIISVEKYKGLDDMAHFQALAARVN